MCIVGRCFSLHPSDYNNLNPNNSSSLLLGCIRQCIRSPSCAAVSDDGGSCVMAEKGDILDKHVVWWLLMCNSSETDQRKLYRFIKLQYFSVVHQSKMNRLQMQKLQQQNKVSIYKEQKEPKIQSSYGKSLKKMKVALVFPVWTNQQAIFGHSPFNKL